MKRLAIKVLVCSAFVAISAICGWQLTYVIDMLPFNMPIFVEAFIRFWLSVTGTEYPGNPEDMATLALLLYWTVATLLVVALLYLSSRAVRRYLARKKSRQ